MADSLAAALLSAAPRHLGAAPDDDDAEVDRPQPTSGRHWSNQLADVRVLHDDAVERGWDSEAARQARVIDSIESQLRWLKNLG